MTQWVKTLAMQACLAEFDSWNPCKGGKKEPTAIVKWGMETGTDGSLRTRQPAKQEAQERPCLGEAERETYLLQVSPHCHTRVTAHMPIHGSKII